jgi:hypothetical protein
MPGTGGVIYRFTITDDFTRWRWLKLVTNKREETILEAFKEYKAMAEAQHTLHVCSNLLLACILPLRFLRARHGLFESPG